MRIAILALIAVLVGVAMADRLPMRRCKRAKCKLRFWKRNCKTTCAAGAPEIPEEDQEPEDEPLDCEAAIFTGVLKTGGKIGAKNGGFFETVDPLECQKNCEANPECEYFNVWDDPESEWHGCWLKTADVEEVKAKDHVTSGYKCCAPLVSVDGGCGPVPEE